MIRERKNDNPSQDLVFICCYWKKHFEEEIKVFWLRGRERYLLVSYMYSYKYNTVLVWMYIYMDRAGNPIGTSM